MIFPLPLPACQLCVSQLCASSFCGCFRWPLVAIRGSPNVMSIACRLFSFLSLFGVSIVGAVFVGVSVFLTGSVASATARFCSIYPIRPLFASATHCLAFYPSITIFHFLSSTVLCGWSLIGRLFWSPFWPRSVTWQLLAIRYLAIPAIFVVVFVGSTSFGAVR